MAIRQALDAGDHFMSLALRRGSGPRRFTLGAADFFIGRADSGVTCPDLGSTLEFIPQ
jgi:hypothetical protein